MSLSSTPSDRTPASSVPTPAAGVVPATPVVPQPSRWRWLRHFREPFFAFAVFILVAVVLVALGADLLYPGDPLDLVGDPLLWPGQDAGFPLGTDALGHDLASGLAHGARISLLIGGSAALVGLFLGATIGAIAGYFGGVIDNILVRIIELFQSIPPIVLTIVILAVGGASIRLVALAIGVASWPLVARLVRSQFMTLRDADFAAAARLLGFSSLRIIASELLPNVLPTIIVTTSIMVATGILSEAGLAFLNLSDPNLVSWGSMIGAGRPLLRSEWYVAAEPGIAILLTVLSLNIVGDRLSDILDPRARQR